MMFPMLHLALALLAPLLASAAPHQSRADADANAAATKNFYLLATSAKTDVPTNGTGIDLVDPFYEAQYLLRVQPNAATYSLFNRTAHGVLETFAQTPHNQNGTQPYKSNFDADASEFYFLPNSGAKPGKFSFKGNYLAYDGSTDGFTQCDGALDLPVVFWNGTDASCKTIYIYKQKKSPPIAVQQA